ncbi:MAG: sortase [Clostridia bacterium]|jgi:LPXTG-site transpeptidase (sortase) family protein|nr:sortase [Clostridia bacterium]
MNQILVTEKIYVTPELKRKKKLYKIKFLLSIFLICSLFSYYIYAEYDRNKNEEVSREILANIDLTGDGEEAEDTTIRLEGDVLIVMLDEETNDREEIDISKLGSEAYGKTKKEYISESGDKYSTDAILNIPGLEINYPVLSKTTDELLKLSLTKFWGGEPNEVGNYVIVGHNYKNKKMFGKLSAIQIGDDIELTDFKGEKLTYKVYDKYIVSPNDTSCTSQNTKGNKEITLITCTNYGTQRLIVKAREAK